MAEAPVTITAEHPMHGSISLTAEENVLASHIELLFAIYGETAVRHLLQQMLQTCLSELSDAICALTHNEDAVQVVEVEIVDLSALFARRTQGIDLSAGNPYLDFDQDRQPGFPLTTEDEQIAVGFTVGTDGSIHETTMTLEELVNLVFAAPTPSMDDFTEPKPVFPLDTEESARLQSGVQLDEEKFDPFLAEDCIDGRS